MRAFFRLVATSVLLAGLPAWSQSGVPFPDGEALYFTINWPSGLSLGEGVMTATLQRAVGSSPARWNFRLHMEAAVPGVSITDTVTASATEGLCSLDLEKDLRHGEKRVQERTLFDAAAGTAKRRTLDGGGDSEIAIGTCPQDGLTFLYSLRDQLSRGRLTPEQTVYFGAGYQLRLDYVGAETVILSGDAYEGDRLRVSVEGPASKRTFELVIGKDPQRRPLRIQVPLELGSFTMDLQP